MSEIEPGSELRMEWDQVHIDRFHGPLDLLLHLIRTQDIDVFDIPIARITGQFVSAIRGAAELPLERAGAFLEMAAQLVQIKLRMLFPADESGDDEDADPRADLVRRLLEYEHFREAAQRLGEAEQRRAAYFVKGFRTTPSVERATELVPLEVGAADFFAAAGDLFDHRDLPDADVRIRGRAIPIEEKIVLIEERLRDEDRIEFTRLVERWHSRSHTIASLLACLELARRQAVRIRQRVPFAALWIYRAPTPEADAEVE